MKDLHGSKKRLLLIKKQLENYPEPNGPILRKYLSWHETLLESKTITSSSTNRSLGIALQLCDRISNVSLMETAPLERFWSATIQRKCIRKSNGKTFELKKQLSPGSIHKQRTQIIKFYKFISFLNKFPDKEINLFKSSIIQKPDCCTFLVSHESKKREDFKLPTQTQVKLLIEELYKGKGHYSKMAAVFVAISNDCGLRFSEMATLKRKDIDRIEDFFLLTVSESKTAKRTVICALAKKFLVMWFEGTKKTEFVFEPFEGEKDSVIAYNSLRKHLLKAAKKLNIELIPGHAFHTFRHCASSRLREMPTNEKRYFMGWKQDGLESIYTRVGWEDCKEHYFKSLKGNPMNDFQLSEYEAEEKNAYNKMKEELFAEIEAKYLKNKKA